MTLASRSSQQLVLAVVLGVLIGCVFGSIAIALMVAPGVVRSAMAPTPTSTFTATRLVLPTITLAPTSTRTPTSTPVPPPTPTVDVPPATTAPRSPAPSRTVRPIVQHFLVGRPVAMSVVLANVRVNPDPIYLYGTTRFGDLDVHHGEEFENPTGTQVYAAADGKVVTVGVDTQPLCGDDGNKACGPTLSPDTGGFYGRVVVIQLDQSYKGQRVFALYGHLNKISVAKGDQVKQGDPIGEIGMTGVALGPHVHFEIRLGVNDYAHTRNPILWMLPLAGRGSLAGRVVDFRGNPIRGAIISVASADNSVSTLSTETYSRDRWPAVISDDELGENFSMPDLVPGDYIVRVQGQPYAVRATVQEGSLAFVEIGLPAQPTVTPTSQGAGTTP